ncbi:MAG TPA: hypothetical protein VGK04_11200 [Thermoanaerobaculia bacterium]|jgi:hypothetical protein
MLSLSSALIVLIAGLLRINHLSEDALLKTCGCQFHVGPSKDWRRHVIFNSGGGTDPAHFRIDGHDLSLPLISPAEDNDWGGAIGHVTHLVYQKGDVTVRVRRVVVVGCQQTRDDCEYSEMKAVITFVIKNRERRTILAMGSCGC